MRTIRIGRSIGRGFELYPDVVGPLLPIVAVVMAVSALAGVLAQVAFDRLVEATTEQVVRDIFSGRVVGEDRQDQLTIHLINAMSTFVGLATSFVALAAVAAACWIATREGRTPAGGEIAARVRAIAGLLPTALLYSAVLTALIAVPAVLGVYTGMLGALLALAGVVALLVLAIRWYFAPQVVALEGI